VPYDLFNEKADERRLAMQKKLIDLRFKMKGLLTAEQWEAVFGPASASGG
jgi:hypothetical protein